MNGLKKYNDALPKERKAICDELLKQINQALPTAESKIWHGAPVWFINGNPVVGYWNRKNHVQLLFWSGQSFDEPALHAEGSFKAAEALYKNVSKINADDVQRWLEKAKTIQWDYKNIIKKRGQLDRIV